MSEQIQQAPFKLVLLENYDLSNLDLEFRLADFEREPVQSHWLKIVDAIRKGRLFDNIITVMDKQDEGGAYIIIDGQHRYMALKYLYEEGELDTYSIALRILHTVEARDAYRLLNAGKPLTFDDILKSYDNGGIQFFEILRPYCVFFLTHQNRLSYSLVLKTMIFATGSSTAGGSDRATMLNYVRKAEPHNILMMASLLELLRRKDMLHSKHMVVKIAVFYMLARYYYRNSRHANFDSKFSKFVDAVAKDTECAMLARKGRNILVLQEVDRRMQELWGLV